MADRRRPGSSQPNNCLPVLSGVLVAGLRRALRGEPIEKSARRRLVEFGMIKKVPDRFSTLTEKGLKALREFTPNA